MSKQIALAGLDIAKSILQVHAADEDDKLRSRRPANVAAVAIANKTARAISVSAL